MSKWARRASGSLFSFMRKRTPGWVGTSEAPNLSSRQVGDLGEKIALWYLAKRGYRILETNWWAPGRRGELDIVARQRDTLIAVEVRSYSAGEASAAEVLSSDKRRRIVRLLKQYAKQKRRLDCNLRVDLLVVEWQTVGKVSSIQHFQAAATEDDR